MFVIGSHNAGASYSDSLVRANGALGSNWTNGNGTDPQIVSNAIAIGGSTDGYYPTAWHLPVNTDEYYVQFTLSGAASSVACGLIIRANSSWSQQVVAFISSTGTAIYTVTGASDTSATSRASNSTVVATSAVLRFQVSGNVYTLLANGSSVLSWTDSGSTQSQGAGFRLGGCVEQRSSFTNSAPLTSFVMADY